MTDRLEQVMRNQHDNYIYPFLWMHGEDHERLIDELDRIRESNIRAVCIEARPHPDFGGERWWRDMDVVMDYARTHGMKVWLLDDDRFPTGHANKAFSAGGHELANEFLTYSCTDVNGPLVGGSMIVHSVLPGDGKLIGAVACKRISGDSSAVDLSTATDLTGAVRDGWLRLDVPDGLWRIFIFYTTHQGNGKLDYFNILNSQSVQLLLERVYQPHFEHYGADFGKTFTGFFSDEPEFGNLPWYDFRARLGQDMPFIPWSEELQARLTERWPGELIARLPALWYECGEETAQIRYEYMDAVTKQVKCAFSDQISKWCEEHRVMHLGHIIEDDNSHGRLGCSTGHYFRSLSGMSMAGIDVVLLQVMPGMHQTVHQWVVSERDGEFFHYGLGKLGSSLAHIDAKKGGNAMCEIFGAYGWQEGIGLMKWLTDHMLSRGINHFVPHAFSPKTFPDPDCPPHFYAGGNHPQYAYFGQLMTYMNRAAHLFSGGRYPAQVAVLYHAEAEWAEAGAMLFQKPLRALMENQIEGDVIPADVFGEENPYRRSFDGRICIAGQKYEALVIPECEYLPTDVAKGVATLCEQGFPVYFINRFPGKICEYGKPHSAACRAEAELIKGVSRAEIVTLETLPAAVAGRITVNIQVTGEYRELRTYPYENDDGMAVYCFNESTELPVDTRLAMRLPAEYQTALRYDLWNNRPATLPVKRQGDRVEVPVVLDCGEATVIVFGKTPTEWPAYRPMPTQGRELSGKWTIFYRDIKETANWHQWAETEGNEPFPDMTAWMAATKFCGMVRYTTVVAVGERDTATRSDLNSTVINAGDKAESWYLILQDRPDGAEIYLNGTSLGKLVGAPYVMELPLQTGTNELTVEIPTTPIWRAGDERSTFTVLPPFGMMRKPLLAEDAGGK